MFCLPGCCDLFNDKALRAAKGAAFRLPHAAGTWVDLHSVATHHGLACLAAALPAEGNFPHFIALVSAPMVVAAAVCSVFVATMRCTERS